MAPHISEELWQRAKWGEGDLSQKDWPKADESLAEEESITLPIQVNGKMRGQIEVAKNLDEAELKEKILSMENVSKFIPDKSAIKRFIVVPGRIVNIVVAEQ